MLFSSVLSDADTFLVLGMVTGVPNNTGKGIIGKIDTAIQFNYYRALGDSANTNYGLFWNTLIQNKSGELIFAGYCNDSSLSAMVGFASRSLDSIKIVRYYPTLQEGFQLYSILMHDDSCYYATGAVAYNNDVDVVLLKIDKTGTKLMERRYNQFAYDLGRKLVMLDNKNILIGAVRNNNNQTLQKSNTWLLEVDTGGNLVRQWFDPNDSTYVAEGLCQTQDGGFIYGAQKKGEQTVNDVYKTATIVKLDSNFNKQWVYHCNIISSYTAITDIEELADGSIIACGNKPYYQTDSNTVSGWIIKLTADGNLLWERVYRGINQTGTLNLLSDIDILPDGGLIAVGQCQLSGATPPQVGWFLKLDSNGCEIENCVLSSPLTPEGGTAMQVYPNPTNGRFQVKLPDGMQGAVLSVYDVVGKRLLSQVAAEEQIPIDVSAFSKGLYFVTAQKGERVLSVKLLVE